MAQQHSHSRPPIIGLWSAPRSRSTAFLRMMMERDDMVALHEPFSQRADFGVAEVDGVTARTEDELIAAIRGLAARSATVFFKDTTDFHYPGVLADRQFLRDAVHTFIIRHPREVIASHYALNPALTVAEVGFARLHELYLAVEEATGATPVVVDSDGLLENPEKTVQAYCERVGLEFRPDALQWSAGMPAEWRKTERWHLDAGNTSGFVRAEKQYESTVDNNPTLAGYYAQELPHYEFLYERRLTV
jgi:hypothetical protein